jgi:hypothetical protein
MSNQEAFETMVQHLRKQGRRSVLDDVSQACVYRSPDGLKCAIGALIPYSEYKAEFEGKPVTALFDYGLFESLDALLLINMQNVHDFTPVDKWEERFQDLAEEYDLTLPEDRQ